MASSSTNSLSAIDAILHARLLLEIILHPLSCLAVLHNWRSFSNTRQPERLMYFTSTGWLDLPPEAARTLKRCFERRTLAKPIKIHGIPFVANLLGMVLVDSTGKMRSIAWIDANGNSFFPKKVFCGGAQSIGEVGGRMIPTSAATRPCFDSLEDLEKLEQTNHKYKKVRKTFLMGMKEIDQGANVTAIYSCSHVSTFGKSRLMVYESTKEVTKGRRRSENERYGWYGANPKRVEAIISGGFGLEDAHLGCGSFGSGIYLSPRDYSGISASYSKPDITGEYHVLLCQVILGSAEEVAQGSNQYSPSSEGFDNAVVNFKSPRCYIIWTANMSTHIIPRYVVSFKVSNHLQEHWRRIQHMRASRRRKLARPIPLRSPEQALLPRLPRHLARYIRNKNIFQ